ncbi:hypothetical protein Pmar_PMAR015590 [Perkinsus marinus ATCC 50983]|uniref:Peptidase A1 domain-containing protein n=1 Tax=Perkinsus marinus (strain ATCC 50983 / TXsc) TaxID=423536 RepID=C5KUJ5_PERM5|nr:hypothetical protein Pmar_PMAR015590 [Perkinsus marinus ATCC 50983]EER11882.1 hypothetical protein Pmar_PMAR015590 [Perkinsus marinus ATCC 50983]|eukprot:XP_002780087.1 hypothetical protein Pmar_PMAR015590 [Perkinsus marinus ATCC 50983]
MSDIIALYLYPPTDPTGASTDGGPLLGGSDPALYEGALKYVDSSMGKGYRMNIAKLRVGDVIMTCGINMNLDLDTGANYLYVPDSYYDRLIKVIGSQTNKAADKHIDFKFDSKDETWSLPCQYMSQLPLLMFALCPQGLTPFTMTFMNYAVDHNDICLVTRL